MSAMKKLKLHVSKKEVSRVRDNTDLMLEILSKLHAKAVAKFHCVSKNWDSLLNSSDFTNMFMKRACDRPNLLFTFHDEGKLSFFWSSQDLISNHNSNLVKVDNHVAVYKGYSCRVCAPVCGLLCTKDEWILGGSRDSRMMICNPSIGKFNFIPKVKTRRGQVITFFGYDPIETQYKVLCMTISERPFMYKAEEYQILTLGTDKLQWRMIECGKTHYPNDSDICINGVLYYLAGDSESGNDMIVCFDVKNEVFRFIMSKAPIESGFPLKLVNYNGRLGGIPLKNSDDAFIDGDDESFELWILDVEEEKWLKCIHILPPLWKELVDKTRVYIVGMIGTSEIVFSPYTVSNPFYIFHFDMETKSIRRVEVQGLGPVNGQDIFTFINHVENVKCIM